jgi:hypothetical protein
MIRYILPLLFLFSCALLDWDRDPCDRNQMGWVHVIEGDDEAWFYKPVGTHEGEEFGRWGCFDTVEVRSCAVVRIDCGEKK